MLPAVPKQIKKYFLIYQNTYGCYFLSYSLHLLKKRVSILRQNNIRNAVMPLGWNKEPLVNVFDLLKADLTIVNDLPDFYQLDKSPSKVKFTGPLFFIPDDDIEIDPNILSVFCSNIVKSKIFCTLSSAGAEEMLKPILEAFTHGGRIRLQCSYSFTSLFCRLIS